MIDVNSSGEDPAKNQPWRYRGVSILAVLLFILIITAVFLIPDPADTSIAEAVMPDGTILVLNAVTYGTEHELALPKDPNRMFSWILSSPREDAIERKTWNNALVVWLTRRDPKTGKALDFDWWLKNTVIDGKGAVIQDRWVYINYFSNRIGEQSSGRHSGGDRPFEPETSKYDLLYASSVLPIFRCAGETFQLRVHNADDEIVATFDVPWPGPKSFPTWKPETLPISKPAGDLMVTLNKLSAYSFKRNDFAKQLSINSEFEVTKNGQPARWHVENLHLADAMGNESQMNDCILSPRESAWKIIAEIFRDEVALTEPSETWNVGEIAINPDGEYTVLNQNNILNDVAINISASGGAGVVAYSGTGDYQGTGSSGSGQSFKIGDDHATVEVDTNYNGPKYTRTINSKLPYLVLNNVEIPELKQLHIQAKDNLENPVIGELKTVDDCTYWFYVPSENATEIDVNVIITQGRRVEFLVAPPEVNHE